MRVGYTREEGVLQVVYIVYRSINYESIEYR